MKAPRKEILVALVVGVCVGWFAASKFSHPPMHDWKNGRMLERFSRKLDLTPDQKEKVAGILEVKREQFLALRSQVKPQFEEIRSSSRAEIRKLLDPVQQEKFDRLQTEREARRKTRRAAWVPVG